MAAEFSWVPPLVVLAVGAVAGAAVVALNARFRSGVSPNAGGSEVSDLRRRYDALIRRLAEGVGDEERRGLEIEAARTLKALDAEIAAPRSDQPPVMAIPKPQAPAWMGFAYGMATMGVIGGLLYFAFQGSVPRTEGGSVTGGNPARGPMSGAPESGIAALESAVRSDPRNIARRIELTRAYLEQRDLMNVFEQTKAILEIEPGNAHALTYQALVRVAMGQADQAETMLLTALKTNPRIEDAYIHLAIARIQLGNRKGAEQAIADGQKQFPDDKEALAQVFAQITSAVDDKKNEPGATPAHPDTAAGPAPTTAGVEVVVELKSGETAPEGALLFVIAREAGFASGPPVAVKRMPATGFPVTVTLTDKDSMAGESLPGLLRIDARIDRDGDPLTKDPRDPVASEDNIRRGAGPVRLTLAPPK